MRYPAEPMKAPRLVACKECWAAPGDDGELVCGHDAGVHRWTAKIGHVAVLHPARPGPLVGRFRFPVNAEQLEDYQERLRGGLRLLELDPEVPGVQWWIEADPTIPERLLERLKPPVEDGPRDLDGELPVEDQPAPDAS